LFVVTDQHHEAAFSIAQHDTADLASTSLDTGTSSLDIALTLCDYQERTKTRPSPQPHGGSISLIVMVTVFVLIIASARIIDEFPPLVLLYVCLGITAVVLDPMILRSLGGSIPELFLLVKIWVLLRRRPDHRCPYRKLTPVLCPIYSALSSRGHDCCRSTPTQVLWDQPLKDTVIETSSAKHVRHDSAHIHVLC